MPIIRFVKNYPPLEVATGANLMEQLLLASIPVASSCHGDGVCAKCRIQVVQGAENLSKINAVEELVRDRFKIAREFRLSCQTAILGDMLIDTAYW